MKKSLLSALIVVSMLAIGGYYLYKAVLPKIMEDALVADSPSPYIPKRLQHRIQDISTPLNKGTEAVVVQMHSSGIPMEKLMATIDETSEREMYGMLDELNKKKPGTIHEVFDIAKKHLNADFDAEVLREPFVDHVNMKQVQKILGYANNNRITHDLDFETAKAVLKKIILEKEKELAQEGVR